MKYHRPVSQTSSILWIEIAYFLGIFLDFSFCFVLFHHLVYQCWERGWWVDKKCWLKYWCFIRVIFGNNDVLQVSVLLGLASQALCGLMWFDCGGCLSCMQNVFSKKNSQIWLFSLKRTVWIWSETEYSKWCFLVLMMQIQYYLSFLLLSLVLLFTRVHEFGWG